MASIADFEKKNPTQKDGSLSQLPDISYAITPVNFSTPTKPKRNLLVFSFIYFIYLSVS